MRKNKSRTQPPKIKPIVEVQPVKLLFEPITLIRNSQALVIQSGPEEYKVTFYTIVPKLVCPNCRKVQMEVLQATNGKIKKICDRCRSHIFFEFQIFADKKAYPTNV